MSMMLGAATLAASCVSENHSELEPTDKGGMGVLTIDLKSDLPFTANTRAVDENEYHNTDNYTVRLVNVSDGSEVFSCLASDLNDHLPCDLPIEGYYKVEAWYGVEHKASREEFRVEGSAEFTVQSEEEKKLLVTCTPTCGKLTVEFDSDMAKYFEDYNVTYGGTKALAEETITWEKTDMDPWYIALTPEGETVKYTINLTTKDAYVHVNAEGEETNEAKVEGSFTLQRNRAQHMKIAPKYTPGDSGLSITISIDDKTNEKNYEWEVPADWIY